MRLSDLGEIKTIELIRRITTTYPTLLNANRNIEVGIGDDACIIKDGTIITTDAYIEDIHFSLDYFSFYEIG
ncbi:MAG: hypothetical protein N2748_05660, partial [candidate division WOR-3 bacterium]|nr:hypothetical protein [candidate division WOR-3 bacterium]